jgi:hypothetical protein
MSPTRFAKVHAIARPSVLVPIQTVRRRVTVLVVGASSIWISDELARKERARPEMPRNVQVSSGAKLRFDLGAGQGLWCLTQGEIVPVSVVIEYRYDDDPDARAQTEAMFDQANGMDEYDVLALQAFEVTDDPLARCEGAAT